MTGTFVLSVGSFDIWHDAVLHVRNAALSLLQKYLTRPPQPGSAREDIAAEYGLSRYALRRDNRMLAAAGLLRQLRRQVGKGLWQHLIVAVAEPALMPAPREAWDLLDASLASGQADARPDAAPAASSAEPESSQVTTPGEKRHIEPVNNRPPGRTDHKPSVVRSVPELIGLSTLPPLPAPTDMVERGEDWRWRTPAQVLGLARTHGAANLERALALLARNDLPFYLADLVVALMGGADYGTDELHRVLAGVHEAEHPYAVARWRLMKLICMPRWQERQRERELAGRWRAPSTTFVSKAPPDPEATRARGLAAARAALRRAKETKVA
ncbi:hypothetical protein [Acrocarpospora pleiomorpha]|uniref:hypothetical protein n=1 Tax=Acrocarpospora pleiomorpha TaxID=90975 RepID=UPI0012D3167E|nr:hypothetical protein [Acrocarpospora pleiomorpha]